MRSPSRTITLGAGCFWCAEAVFGQVKGITAVESGYTNGYVVAPTYEQVCTGQTGHVQVVELTYDPQIISLRQILEVFLAIHDPTTRDRQGDDQGPQYRSGIYVDNDADAAVAKALLAEVGSRGRQPVVTEVCNRENYWPAEEYHRHFCDRHPNAGYCSMVVEPTVRKVRQEFAGLTADC